MSLKRSEMIDQMSYPTSEAGATDGAYGAFFVACSDSTGKDKDRSDDTLDGTADEVQINALFAQLT